MALGKLTSQHSDFVTTVVTDASYSSIWAVDGILQGPVMTEFSQTNTQNQVTGWWMVNLVRVYTLMKFVIYPRPESGIFSSKSLHKLASITGTSHNYNHVSNKPCLLKLSINPIHRDRHNPLHPK